MLDSASVRRRPPSPGSPPWHSVLEPHLAQIWALRREGKTYREIASLLAAQGLKVSHTSVFKFVRARKRRILANRLPDLPSDSTGRVAPAATLSHAFQSPVTAEIAEPDRMEPMASAATSKAAKPVIGSDGKEIRGAQYSTVKSEDL